MPRPTKAEKLLNKALARVETLLDSADPAVALQAARQAERLSAKIEKMRAAADEAKPSVWERADFIAAERATCEKAKQDAAGQKPTIPPLPDPPQPLISKPDATAPAPKPQNPTPGPAPVPSSALVCAQEGCYLGPIPERWIDEQLFCFEHGEARLRAGANLRRQVAGAHEIPESVPDTRAVMQPFDRTYNPPPMEITPGVLVGTYTQNDGWFTRDESGEWRSERERLVATLEEREREEREAKLYGR
jgi:hypothetical protein